MQIEGFSFKKICNIIFLVSVITIWKFINSISKMSIDIKITSKAST